VLTNQNPGQSFTDRSRRDPNAIRFEKAKKHTLRPVAGRLLCDCRSDQKSVILSVKYEMPVIQTAGRPYRAVQVERSWNPRIDL
jgi:hypothetical protein